MIRYLIFQIAIRHLWYNYTLQTAMEMKRYHHQLFPMEIEFENAFDMVSHLPKNN